MFNCCRQIRRIVEEAPWGDSAHGFLVVGGEGVLVDSVDEVFRESPPILVGVTLTVLFVVAGLAFRSLLIPLRLLATVVVTLVATAALTVLLYQLVLGYDGATTLGLGHRSVLALRCDRPNRSRASLLVHGCCFDG